MEFKSRNHGLMSTHSSLMRAGILAAYSAAGVLTGSILLATIYYFLVIPIDAPPTFFEILRWMFLVWSPWIVIAPVVIVLSERISALDCTRWQILALYAALAGAMIAVHALLYAFFSTWIGPYASLRGFGSAIDSYVTRGFPIALLLYFALVAGTSRAVTYLHSFSATPEGLLRTRRGVLAGISGASDPGLEAMPGPVLVYDPETLDILAVNEAAIKQYGWSANEFQRMSLLDIREKKDMLKLLDNLRRTRNLPIWRSHSRHLRKDGKSFEIELTNHAVIFNGRWARMILVTDVTAAERAQQALAESERKSREIIEHAVVGFFQSTPDGKMLMLNRSAAQALGYDDPEQALKAITDIGSDIYVEPQDRKEYLDAIRRDGYVSNWMSRLRRRDGTVMWNVENSRGVFDEEGNLEYVEGTIKDVTDEVLAREALQESERRAAELRVQLANAQLRALKLQLKPHFLFNLLNTVAMMIRSGEADKAQRVVTLLGDMFRRFLEFEGEETVPLERELSFLDLYLGLEQYRYSDRMEIHREIDPESLDFPVPTLILQPIAENAIKHGVARMSDRCRIDLVVKKSGGELVVELINDACRSENAGGNPGHGIGLSNTRSRLGELYGGRAGFELAPRAGRVHAILRIPTVEATG